MLKIISLIFIIAGQTQSYVFEEPPNPEFDRLGNCVSMFPKDHVIRRGCYCAHTVCRRQNLNPNFVNDLVFNDKIYNDIEMKLPSGASIPYSIYEADPSLFDALYDKILIQTDPQLTLQEYRQIINDSDFRIAKALHHTKDQILLSEMIEIMLDHLQEDDVTAIVGDWFQGDFKIIVPLINDYLPELEDITVVKIADNYPKLSIVKKVMNDRNITLEKVNPHFLSPVTMNNGQEIRVEKIRQILDFFKAPNNATVLPGVEYELLKNMANPINLDGALPIWQWMKVYDEIQLKDYQYGYYDLFSVIQLMPGSDSTPAPTLYTTESTTKDDSDIEDEEKPNNRANISNTPDITTRSSGGSENYDSSTPVLDPEIPESGEEEVSQGTAEKSDTDEDHPLDQFKTPSFSETLKNKDSYVANNKQDLEEEENSDQSSPENASNSELDEEENQKQISEEKNTKFEVYSQTRGKSADEKTNSIPTQPHHADETNRHQKVNYPLQPHLEKLQQKVNPKDHLPTALSFFSNNKNVTAPKFQDKIFTTCALYYLKVNSTQNRIILSEAGILSFPMKRICDELLRLETYNGSHVERVEQIGDLRPSEKHTLLAGVGDKNSSQKSRDKPSNVRSDNSSLKIPDKSSASAASHEVEHFKVDSNRQVLPSAFSTGAHPRPDRDSEKDEPLENTLSFLNGPSDRSADFKRDPPQNPSDYPISPFDDEKYDPFDRPSNKRDIYQNIHKPIRRPTVSPFIRHRFHSPLIRSEESLLDEPFSEYSSKNSANLHRSRRLPRTPIGNRYKSFEVPREMDPYSMSKMEEESDSDVGFAEEDRFPSKEVYNHFRRDDSLYPLRRKDYEVNRRSMEEKLKSMHEEEMENYEARRRYFGALKDMKEKNHVDTRQKQPKVHKSLEIHSGK